MPRVRGFLRFVDLPGSPDEGQPPDEGGMHPDQGLPVPAPPPGVWPPPIPAHPIQPAPPDTPPGSIWPSPGTPSQPLPPGAPAKFWVLVVIPGYGWRYVCIEPQPPEPEVEPEAR
jgi:hypothetical protein